VGAGSGLSGSTGIVVLKDSEKRGFVANVCYVSIMQVIKATVEFIWAAEESNQRRHVMRGEAKFSADEPGI
jgi:hypothetical protein